MTELTNNFCADEPWRYSPQERIMMRKAAAFQRESAQQRATGVEYEDMQALEERRAEIRRAQQWMLEHVGDVPL